MTFCDPSWSVATTWVDSGFLSTVGRRNTTTAATTTMIPRAAMTGLLKRIRRRTILPPDQAERDEDQGDDHEEVPHDSPRLRESPKDVRRAVRQAAEEDEHEAGTQAPRGRALRQDEGNRDGDDDEQDDNRDQCRVPTCVRTDGFHVYLPSTPSTMRMSPDANVMWPIHIPTFANPLTKIAAAYANPAMMMNTSAAPNRPPKKRARMTVVPAAMSATTTMIAKIRRRISMSSEMPASSWRRLNGTPPRRGGQRSRCSIRNGTPPRRGGQRSRCSIRNGIPTVRQSPPSPSS